MSGLYEMLAEAYSMPSRGYRTAIEATDAIGNIDKGFQAAKAREDADRKRKLQMSSIAQILGGPIEGLPANLNNAPLETIEAISPAAKFMKTRDGSLDDFVSPEQLAAEASGDFSKMGKAYGGLIPAKGASRALSFKGQREQGERSSRNFDFREKGRAVAFGKAFDSDPDVQKAFTEFNQSRRAKQVLAAGNPIGDASVRIIAARAAGEVGNLAQAEQEVFGGSPAMMDWLARNAQRLTQGTLDETDRQYMNELFDVYANYSQSRINNKKNFYASRYSVATGESIEEAERLIGDLSQLGVNPDIGDVSMHAVAKNAQGITIETNDGGKTWKPVKNGN